MTRTLHLLFYSNTRPHQSHVDCTCRRPPQRFQRSKTLVFMLIEATLLPLAFLSKFCLHLHPIYTFLVPSATRGVCRFLASAFSPVVGCCKTQIAAAYAGCCSLRRLLQPTQTAADYADCCRLLQTTQTAADYCRLRRLLQTTADYADCCRLLQTTQTAADYAQTADYGMETLAVSDACVHT